jgi:hypothetical protein
MEKQPVSAGLRQIALIKQTRVIHERYLLPSTRLMLGDCPFLWM